MESELIINCLTKNLKIVFDMLKLLKTTHQKLTLAYALCLLTLLFCSCNADPVDHWAVLVAGSNGYWNYRHQADICHAYHILKQRGIPEEQIIVFAYDDIASNSQNPFPGKLFNKIDGDDVYEGCKIDYRGADINPQKFLQVLKGEGNGKVLQSNSNSRVFINFSDHGAPGLIAFPRGELYAKDLHETLKEMHSLQMYSEMVIYIEACHSGSMFEDILKDNLNVYATTASNAGESSWAYYCPPDDTINGVSIGSCLGDEYSIHWMEDTDQSEKCSHTLKDQFEIVRQATKNSHVQEFGTLAFKNSAIDNFEGVCESTQTIKGFLKSITNTYSPKQRYNSIDSRFAKMDYLYNRFKKTQSPEDSLALEQEIQNRRKIEERFNKIKYNSNTVIEENPRVTDYDCYKDLVSSYKGKCGFDEYDLSFLNHFVSICNAGMNRSQMLSMITDHC